MGVVLVIAKKLMIKEYQFKFCVWKALVLVFTLNVGCNFQRGIRCFLVVDFV